MELALANILSNLLPLLFKSLFWDILTSVNLSFQFFPIKCCETQISNSFDPLLQESRNDKPSRDEKRISIEDMNLTLKRLGMECVMEENGNSRSFGEDDFLALFEDEEPSLEEIKETFGVFDANKDGFIDASELGRVICNLGMKENYGLEECKKMIKTYDSNGDGLIDFQEFVKFMEKSLC